MQFLTNNKTLSHDIIALSDGISTDILENYPLFTELVEYYYEYLNQKDYPIYEIKNILANRDIDTADEDSLRLLLNEIALNLPTNITTDKRVLYKNILDLYKSKGTINSFKIFFQAFFGSGVNVSYPREDLFTLDGARWDQNIRVPEYDGNTYIGEELGGYTNEVGFLDNLYFLRDDYFYQEFSYVLKTASNFDEWKYLFNKVCHPSGFIFFGDVEINIEVPEEYNYSRIANFVSGLTEPRELETLIEVTTDFIDTRYNNAYNEIVQHVELNNLDTRYGLFNLPHDMYFNNDDITTYFDRGIDTIFNINNSSPEWDKSQGIEIYQPQYNYAFGGTIPFIPTNKNDVGTQLSSNLEYILVG